MTSRLWPPELLAPRLAVYLVADPEQTDRDLRDDVAAALANGATCIQLRAKRLEGADFFRLGSDVCAMCRAVGVPFVVNDRIDVALAVDADGVHVGVADLPLAETRRLVGPARFVGYSPLDADDIASANSGGADYVGIGPVAATASKSDAQPPLGLAGLATQARLARVPVVAIGGITLASAPEVIRAGADGVAVISAILRASDPGAATAALAKAVQAALTERPSRP